MLSVIIPANNEGRYIGGCLGALIDSRFPDAAAGRGREIIVVANACTDDTVAVARSFADRAEARGWRMTVLDLAKGGKINAINQGDAAATGDMKVYLDADVIVSPDLIAQVEAALDRPDPVYATGRPQIAKAESFISGAYAALWSRLPYMQSKTPGFGIFAVNAPARARWGAFPEIIADDMFARFNFKPEERVGVPATYSWPVVEGFQNLVKVRRRQNAGMEQLQAHYPELLVNEDKLPVSPWLMLRLAISHPIAFAVYAAVSVATKFGKSRNQAWTRGR